MNILFPKEPNGTLTDQVSYLIHSARLMKMEGIVSTCRFLHWHCHCGSWNLSLLNGAIAAEAEEWVGSCVNMDCEHRSEGM